MNRMLADLRAGHQERIPSELVPRCSYCGGPMRIHMVGHHFIKDSAARQRMAAARNAGPIKAYRAGRSEP